MDDHGGQRDADPAPSVSRRRLFALLGAVGVGATAGCGGGDGDATTSGSGTTTTTDDSTTATAGGDDPTTAGSTTTERSTTGGRSTTDGAQPSTETPTTTAAEPSLVAAPSSDLSPLDGWATGDWIAEREPELMRVTTLAPSGPGSLRAAINAEGPRLVVFEVGGVVDLRETSGLGVETDGLFLAGQTAPSPGITVVGGDIRVDATDVVVQHVRVRPGDGSGGAADAMTADSEAANVIVDHCSTTWAVDENLSTGGGPANHDVTFSNNIIAEGLSDSIHPKGPHSKGTLVMNDTRRVAIIGNVYSDNVQRNPRLKGGTTSAVVNNYVDNFGVAVGMGQDSTDRTRSALVGNHFVAGPDSDRDDPIVHGAGDPTPRAFVEDTIVEPESIPLVGDGVQRTNVQPAWPWDRIEPLPAGEVRAHNLATAGARPADRSPHDERVIGEVRRGEGGVIDSQREVGGYPDLPSTERTLDPPAWGDGVVEWLYDHTLRVEVGHGLE